MEIKNMITRIKFFVENFIVRCKFNSYIDSENLNFEQLIDMPIPDEVFFGRDNFNKIVTFKDVRAITDQDELLNLLKKRLDHILINQVNFDANKSPFPLALMACVGIETLGQISIKKSSNDKDSKLFVETLKKFDQSFGQSITPSFKEKMVEILGSNSKVLSIDNFAQLIYYFFRNSMIHGYHGKGVFLSNEDTECFKPVDSGFLILNPQWLWEKYKEIYDEVFHVIRHNKQSNERRNCLKYLSKLIS